MAVRGAIPAYRLTLQGLHWVHGQFRSPTPDWLWWHFLAALADAEEPLAADTIRAHFERAASREWWAPAGNPWPDENVLRHLPRLLALGISAGMLAVTMRERRE